MTRWPLLFVVLSVPMSAHAKPLRDPIPAEFLGTFAPSLAQCREPYGVELILVESERIHYYEGDDFLLLGIEFSGSSTKSGNSVPLFNGRFTGRMETQLLGEVNARMEMETPNMLIRYVLKEDGEPDPKPVNVWVRCPSRTSK